jgi:hypothetical protein
MKMEELDGEEAIRWIQEEYIPWREQWLAANAANASGGGGNGPPPPPGGGGG